MASTMSVAFVDPSVTTYESLVKGIKSGIQVHILDANQDGILEITEFLRSQPLDANIQDIHLVSHGAPGCLFLGKTALNLETLERYRQDLAAWRGRSLLLYGCQVAAGDAGTELLDQLHQITGAAVSASTTTMGSPAQGGNWQLDAVTPPGDSAAPLAFSDTALAAYAHTLPGPIAPDSSGASTSNIVPLQFGTPTVANSSGAIGALGTVATYRGVANARGQTLDMTVTIVGTNDTSWTANGVTSPPSFQVLGNDAKFQFSAGALAQNTSSSTANKTTKFRFEFWKAGEIGITPVSISFGFNIKDLDKQVNKKSGAVSIPRSQVSSYGVNNPTKLIPPANNGSTDLVFVSTADNTGSEQDPEFALQLNFESKSAVEITLATEFDKSGFVFDGDRQFQFSNLITVGGDQYTTSASSTLSVPAASGILANDSDPDNAPQPLRVTQINGQATAIGQQITLPSGAFLTVQSNGSFVYDPRGKSGFDSFIYTVSDGLESDDATVDITVTGSNSPPVLDLNGPPLGVDYSALSFNGGSLAIAAPNATLKDLDSPDIKTLSLNFAGLRDGASEKLILGNTTQSLNANSSTLATVSGIASTIQLTLSNSGTTISLRKSDGTALSQAEANILLRSISYQNTAAAATVGDRVFTLSATDSATTPNTSNIATSTLSIQLPLTSDTASTSEDTAVTTNVQANDNLKGAVSIPTGQTLRGSAMVSNDSIIYTPNAFFSGRDEITYQVGSQTAKLLVTVIPVAETPTATAINATGIQNQPLPLTVGASALLDTDGSEQRSFEISDVPSGSSFSNPTGSAGTDLGGGIWRFNPGDLTGLKLIPPAALTGTTTLNLRAIGTDKADLNGDGDTLDPSETDTKLSALVPFQITFHPDTDGDGIADQDEPPIVDLNGSATGEDYTATFIAGSAAAVALTTPTATGFDPSGNDIESLQISIAGLVDGAQETLKIGDQIIVLNANSSFSGISVAGTSTLFDISVSGNGSGIAITRQGGGDLSTADVDALLRSLAYKNSAAQPGGVDPSGLGGANRTFAITANDGSQNSNTATSTVSFNVKLVDDSLLIDENALPQIIDVKANDTIAGPITLATNPAQGSASIDNNNILYTPNPNFSGTDELTYRVGAQTAKLSIVVRPVAETPAAAAANPNLIGIQNQPIALGLSGSTPQDNDGSESFRFEITNVPTGASFTNGSSSIGTNEGNGRWSFTAAQLTSLSLVPPASLLGPITLTFQGISTDSADLDKDGNTTDLGEQVTAPSAPVNVQVTFRADANGNGIPDVEEPLPTPLDSDGDGIPNAADLDDDNDGIPDADELQGDPNRDTDGDGILDSLDLDTDNDGIPDLSESGLSPAEIKALDTNGDGRIDPSNIFGSNGLADGVETTPDSGRTDYNNDGIADPPVDSDGDGIADFQDLDSDNDGLSDVIEAGGTDLNGDGLSDGGATDTDRDGLADVVDPTSGSPRHGTPLPVPDTDGDGIADFRDLDSDNDGLSDLVEGGLSPAVFDLNGDGRVDGPDGDGDGIPDQIDGNPSQFGNRNGPTNPSVPDTNGDGIPDYRVPKSPIPPIPPVPPIPPIPPIPPTLEGLSDQDILRGTSGDDRLNGGSESDKIWGYDGNDILNGGSGNDEVDGGNGNDTLSGSSGNDWLAGHEGDDVLNGGSGDDWMDGGNGGDILIGSSGNDRLYGQDSADTLQGGLGDDLLVGGSRSDLLSGGQGRDTFRTEAIGDFGDTILDFEILFDRIDLQALYGDRGVAGTFGITVQVTQIGAHTAVQADVGQGLQQVSMLLNVNAFTIKSSHFVF